ncbi:MAG: hypothetical protein J7M40_16005 [Planctomycetes bacterium]|nr:hypothetical protein [Planctomycetota bacterium]
MTEELQRVLDSFDPKERRKALEQLRQLLDQGKIRPHAPTKSVNLHCHTFFSFNTYGYSPSRFAWLACEGGLAAAGIVDFDVLDGLDEFHDACRTLDLKGCVGLETRVFIPEFADKVINSPGEPGISYHMGVGMPSAKLEGADADFLANLKKTAQQRNRALIGRVNKYLSPVELDYDIDVIPLTPASNPTERHMCLAYARKAKALFGDPNNLARYWTEKLGVDAEPLGLPEGRDLLNTIRQKTMKKGGVGYVKPDTGSFPTIHKMNEFILSAGGIPTHTWLNGLSDGEKDMENLLGVAMSTGAAALNVIPDRNYASGVKDEKLTNLYRVVELAEKLGLPLVMGTEMNSPGQKFVDDFDSAELAPLAGVFLKGAHIVYAHSVLQRAAGLGYTGDWAKNNFKTTADKNAFFESVGEKLQPAMQDKLAGLNDNSDPQEILRLLAN